jgi:hypothetical protein
MEMRRAPTTLRFSLIVLCVLALIGIAALAEDDGGKTWDDAVALLNRAVDAYQERCYEETLTAGDEIVGLTRAFLYAGTPSVLSSLWRVVSQTPEPLMVAFYGHLQQGLDKAEALRQAQLDVMATYSRSRYWAAFELVGDWR